MQGAGGVRRTSRGPCGVDDHRHSAASVLESIVLKSQARLAILVDFDYSFRCGRKNCINIYYSET